MAKDKSNKKVDNRSILEVITNEIIRLVSLFIILNLVQYFVDSSIYTSSDKLKLLTNNVIILASSIVSFFVINFIRIFTKPIRIKVDLVNKATGNSVTTIFHSYPGREDSETLVVKVTFNNTNSIWKHVAYKYIVNKKVELHIFDEWPEPIIICQPICSQHKNIKLSNKGAVIKLDFYLQNNLINNVKHEISFEFIIKENRDAPVHGVTAGV